MTWLVFLVGVVLALAGAASVAAGAPIIQIERGWAEVIAGTVAVSGGIVTLALGAILIRLEALRRAVLLGAQGSPVAENREAVEDIREAQPLDAPILASHAEHEKPDDDVDGPLLRPTLADDGPAASEPDHFLEPAAPPVLAVPEPGQAKAAPEPVVPSQDDVHFSIAADTTVHTEAAPDDSAPRRLLAPSSELVSAERDASRQPAPLSRDWLSRPLLRSRATRVLPPEEPTFDAVPPPFEEPVPPAPEPVSLSDAAEVAEEPVAPPIAPVEPAELAPVDEPTAEHAPAGAETTVIGRYQAGASSYTMYANGAIDVETEGGEIHQFGSMDDLKAFIARQERALS